MADPAKCDKENYKVWQVLLILRKIYYKVSQVLQGKILLVKLCSENIIQ